MIKVGSGRLELLRALGAVADSPDASRAVGPVLGLGPVSDADHTDVFVMNLPPYASVYVGPDGALGGEGADRIAGFWRVLRMPPPSEPDHLAALLSLYASLGEAASGARQAATKEALRRTQAVLFAEHLQPWLPAYLRALAELPVPPLVRWAQLMRRAASAEAASQPASAMLPLALRAAPPPVGLRGGARDLAASLTIPVRSGMILTRHRLAQGAVAAGVGHRIGERRYTLRAMLEQDPRATLLWLAGEAARWSRHHESQASRDQVSRWWAERAARTRRSLLEAGNSIAPNDHQAACS